MDENNKNINKESVVEKSAPAQVKSGVVSSSQTATPSKNDDRKSFASRNNGDFKKNPRKTPGRREPKAKPEFDHKIINIRRVTRVVTGGKRFSFSVALVAGNKRGSVGVGLGKAIDTALAIEKATRNAKKNMIKLSLTKDMSIPHEVKSKYASARVLLMPAKGRGIIAGSAVRDVIELAGIKDVTGKILSGSKNKLNIARAAIVALQDLSIRRVRPVQAQVAEQK